MASVPPTEHQGYSFTTSAAGGVGGTAGGGTSVGGLGGTGGGIGGGFGGTGSGGAVGAVGATSGPVGDGQAPSALGIGPGFGPSGVNSFGSLQGSFAFQCRAGYAPRLMPDGRAVCARVGR